MVILCITERNNHTTANQVLHPEHQKQLLPKEGQELAISERKKEVLQSSLCQVLVTIPLV